MSDRIGELNGFYGKKHSEATKKAMSEIKKGIPNDSLGRKISIDGITYPSVAEASRQLGHARKTIRKKVDDPTKENYIAIENA